VWSNVWQLIVAGIMGLGLAKIRPPTSRMGDTFAGFIAKVSV